MVENDTEPQYSLAPLQPPRRRRRNGRGGLSEVGVVAVGGNSKFLLDDTLPTNERSGSQAQQQKVLADYLLLAISLLQ